MGKAFPALLDSGSQQEREEAMTPSRIVKGLSFAALLAAVLTLALGVGAMISAIVAYLLSSRLGLLTPHSQTSTNA